MKTREMKSEEEREKRKWAKENRQREKKTTHMQSPKAKGTKINKKGKNKKSGGNVE